jgi:hypothetical protein
MPLSRDPIGCDCLAPKAPTLRGLGKRMRRSPPRGGRHPGGTGGRFGGGWKRYRASRTRQNSDHPAAATATNTSAKPTAAKVVGSGPHPAAPREQGSDGTPSIITPRSPSTAKTPDTHHPTVTKAFGRARRSTHETRAGPGALTNSRRHYRPARPRPVELASCWRRPVTFGQTRAHAADDARWALSCCRCRRSDRFGAVHRRGRSHPVARWMTDMWWGCATASRR